MSSDPKKSSRPASPSSGGSNRPQAQASSGKSTAKETEPTAGLAPTPIWLILLFALLFYWGQLYLDNHAGGFDPQVYEPYASVKQVKAANPMSDEGAVIAKGEAVYNQMCAVCHQINGLGSAGQFPPLAGSEWVTEPNPARLIRIPLHGLTGPITVKGQDLNLPVPMTPFGETLSNADLAAVLTFIRQSWGHKAPPVTPAQVAKVREETASRSMSGSAPWTAEELLKIPVTQ